MRANYIKDLFNLKEVIIKNFHESHDFIKLKVELPTKPHICPHCGAVTSKIHDYRTQVIKDMPLRFKKVLIYYRKRRYECKSCGKSFFENNNIVRKYFRTTTSLLEYVVQQLKSMSSIKSIANNCGVSQYYVSRLLPYFTFKAHSLPRVLCIDEFKGNSGGFKYNVLLIDGETHEIVDIVKCRYKHYLADYFRSFPQEVRDNVKFFVTDLWNTYRDLAFTFFRHAKVIADNFHYVRYVTKVVDDLRKQVQSKLPADSRKWFKHSRRLLLSRRCKIKSEEDFIQLNYMLINFSEDLRLAYLQKEKLLNIIHSNDDISVKLKQFNDWIFYNSTSSVKGLRECASTYHNWAVEIRNAIIYGYSNGPTEGKNNKIKVYKRICFGLRNFNNFKARLMLMN